MHEAAVQQDRLRLRVTNAAAELSRQAFLDVVGDVDQVGRARHRIGLDFDLLDERQALQADLGTIDRRIGEIAAFHLPDLAPEHVVVDAGAAGEADVADVGAIARIDEERQFDFLRLGVLLRHRIDLREGVPVLAEAQLHELGGRGDHLARKHVALAHGDQRLQLLFGHDQVARDLHVGDAVDLAFLHVERDEDVVLLRRDRDLRRFDVHVRVAAIQVVRTQLLDVARELFARVTIVLLVPGQPVRRLQLEALEQVVVAERFVADDVDLPDLRTLAFDDVDRDLDAVAGDFLDLGFDLHRVLAAREVLVGEKALHFVERRLVERLAAREAHVAQRLLEVLGLDVLVAGDREALDRRAFEHGHHERAAVAADLDVTEKAGCIQRAQRFVDAAVVEPVADVHGQVVVDGAFRDALQAFDPDVADGELRALGLGENGGYG